MASYHHRVHIFIPVEEKDTANTFAAGMDWDTGGNQTFDKALRYSADGQEPATHLAVSTQMADDIFTLLPDAINQVTGAVYYELEQGWTWEQAATDLGLQQIILPPEEP